MYSDWICLAYFLLPPAFKPLTGNGKGPICDGSSDMMLVCFDRSEHILSLLPPDPVAAREP